MSGVIATEVDSSVVIYQPPANNPDGGPATLMGWSLREPSGVDATATIHSGTDASGPIVGVVALALDGATDPPAWFGPQGIRCPGGIFFDVTSGTVEGAIYWK